MLLRIPGPFPVVHLLVLRDYSRHEVEEKGPLSILQAGEECYDSIIWAMTQGIVTNPEWYPGLSTDSHFEDFQLLGPIGSNHLKL